MSARELLELGLWLTAGMVGFAALWTFVRLRRLRAVVGAVRLREHGTRWLRMCELVATLVTLVALSFLPAMVPLAPALGVLVPSLWIFALHPADGDSVWGEEGVQRGWFARRYTEVEEWRLTGDHLRWKLKGSWVACRVPASEHAAMRAKLTALCPDRESRFQG